MFVRKKTVVRLPVNSKEPLGPQFIHTIWLNTDRGLKQIVRRGPNDQDFLRIHRETQSNKSVNNACAELIGQRNIA